jgi:hypothetical protein
MFALLIVFGPSLPPPADAWGQLGHELVAELAQRRLTPAADAAVRKLLEGEPVPTLAGVAMWADWLRQTDPERFKATSRWHYVNLQSGSCKYAAEQACPDGACVVGAIESQLRVLRDPAQPLDARRDALKFVVHLVGDIHQPLHSSNLPDKGGNDFHITLKTSIPPEEYARDRYKDGVMDTNLHSVWDYYVLASAGLDRQAYADRLAKLAAPSPPQGSPPTWATESCRLIERKALYPAVHDLDVAYLNAMRPLAEQRVVRASMRLARLLDEALAPRRSAHSG